MNEQKRINRFIGSSISRTVMNLTENPMWIEEYRQNSSKAHSGKNHHMYGKHLSSITKKRIGLAQKGKKISQETIAKIQEARKHQLNIPSGKEHWNWQGGISTKSERIRASGKLKEWRKAVFERDNHTCQECGIRNEQGLGRTVVMNTHHEIPFAECLAIRFEEMIFNIDNGTTLCYDCHQLTKLGRGGTYT